MTQRFACLAATAAAVGLLSIFGGAAHAADAAALPPTPPTPPHPMRTLKVLTPDQLDPSRLLPPPPADGSPLARADLADVQRFYTTRTPERLARAEWDDKHEDSMIFASTIGDGFDLAKLPVTAKLLALVENEQSVAANMAKRYFLRNRPWAIDTTIVACDYKPNAAPLTSYPSGHATLGYSVGYILANLMPEKSQAILARAAEYAQSREVCGSHYASDTEASHTLGTVVALRLLDNSDVARQVEAARAELRTAHLTSR